MKRVVIFAALLAIAITVVAALAEPLFALLLLLAGILAVLWRIAGNIASNGEEYEREDAQ